MMRSEKQLKQLEEARKNIKNRKHSQETKIKIGMANSRKIEVNCSYCNKEFTVKPSKLKKNKRLFCCRECYYKFASELLPKEEHSAYGTGFDLEEREKRKKARAILNHYLRDKKIERPSCEICGEKAEAHHHDYNKPLEVTWLCQKHHRELHKVSELLEVQG